MNSGMKKYVMSKRKQPLFYIFQGKLKNIKDNVWINLALQTEDKCILWLSYIYLKEFKQLPPELYDPQNQLSGKIVNKVGLFIYLYTAYC